MRTRDLCGRVLLAALLAAAWPAAARADGCFVDKEEGPAACNCTDDDTTASLCTGSSMTVAGEETVNAGLVIPGLSAYFGTKYSQSISITEQVCFSTVLKPGTCAYLLYRFQVCVYSWWEDGWLGPEKKTAVTITYLGVSLEKRPATRDDCDD
jgi:hypothetical protein